MASPAPPVDAASWPAGYSAPRAAGMRHLDAGGHRFLRPSRRGVASLALAALLAAPAAAQGAPRLGPFRWFPAGSPFAASRSSFSFAVLNTRGDALFGGTSRINAPVVRDRRGARGPWSGIIELARPAGDVTAPRVALNATGAGLAVFRRSGRYLSARRGPEGRWRVTGSIAPASSSDQVHAVLTDDGRAKVVLMHTVRGCKTLACPWTVEVFQQRTVTSRWSRLGDPLALSSLGLGPQVAVNRRGDLLVAWVAPGASQQVLASRRLATDATFEPPQTVPGSLVSTAIGDRGDAALAVVVPDPPSATRGQVALRPAASPTWGTPEDLLPPGTSPGIGVFRVAVDADGNAAAALDVRSSPNYLQTVVAAFRGATAGTWEISPALAPTRVCCDSWVAVDRLVLERGRAFVVWKSGPDIGNRAVGLVVRDPSSGTWTPTANPTSAWAPYPPDAFASAPNGRLIIVESNPFAYAQGMRIRNYDGLATPPEPRIISPRVRVSGRFATVTFHLNVGSHVYLSRSAPPSGIPPLPTSVSFAGVLRAGNHRLTLGPIAPGSYSLTIGASNASRGCVLSPQLSFRIR
jgi:hypothetical protein